MLNLVLFGPPGAGKGTQSARLIEKYNLAHLSTGDILRSEISKGTVLGQKARTLMDQGLLVPDEVVIGMIENQINARPDAKGFIFDGFPRTVAQAEALDGMLQKKNTSVSLMLALEVETGELVKRLLLRGKDSGRPDDADPSVISRRIEEYNGKTKTLADYYARQHKYQAVYGIGHIEEIFDNLCNAIESVLTAK